MIGVNVRELLGTLLPHRDIPEIDISVLTEALENPDLETIQEITALGGRDASRLLVRFQESKAGYKVRDVFCTTDARALMRETLTILAQYSVTPVSRSALTTLTPSLNKEDVGKRLSRSNEFLQLFQKSGKEHMQDIIEILAGARFAKTESESPPMVLASNMEQKARLIEKFGPHIRVEVIDSDTRIREVITKEPYVLSTRPLKGERAILMVDETSNSVDVCPNVTIKYFERRRHILQTSIRISKLLADEPELHRLFEDAESPQKVLDLLDALRETSVSIEGIIVEAEEEANEEIKKLRTRVGGMDALKSFIEDLIVELADRLNLKEDEVNY